MQLQTPVGPRAPLGPRANSAIDFVIKISKYCNLRCSYCYEFEELGQRRRMGLDELSAFFTNVRDTVVRSGRSRIHFVWHGGEPLLVPLEYYERIGNVQREVLGDSIEYANLLQTNLTVLTDRHIDFLQAQRFFNHALGVSFDVYGDQRVDTRGRLKTRTVLTNLQRLRDAQVRFGAIAVLARNTLPRIQEIYRFYDSLGIPLRILPFYKSATDAQVAEHSLSFREITGALKRVFDDWLLSERATSVTPVSDYLRYALAAIAAGPRMFHDPDADEHVFLVDTNGDTYGVADTYGEEQRYGNLFDQDLEQLLKSAPRSGVIEEARERMAAHCQACPYFGYCPGTFAAEATAEQRRMLRDEGCPVRDVIQHIIRRVERTAAVDALLSARAQHIERPEIAVGA
jgi:uncharacterized protein